MTNLHELFQIFNGQDVISPIDQTLELFKVNKKHMYLDFEEMINPIKKFLIDLESSPNPVRITNGYISLSAYVLQEAVPNFKEWSISSIIIRSDLMGMATVDNLNHLKSLYRFWEQFDLTIEAIKGY